MTRSTRFRFIPTKMKIEQLEDRTVPTVVFTETFDTTAVGSLPTGWTQTAVVGSISPAATPLFQWRTDDGTTAPPTGGGAFPTPASDSGTKSALIDDPSGTSDKSLTSPTINIPNVAGTQLRFRHKYGLESSFDGGVLEIAIGSAAITAGTFTDFVTAGGTFVSGGYTSTISSSFFNPILGRSAWSGTITAWTTVLATLPTSARNQPVQFRWRMGSDDSVSASGWRVDTVQIATPTPAISVSAGNGQSARVSQPYSSPLSVLVLDGFGLPSSGVTATFTSLGTGAGVTFPNGNTAVSDVNGIASVAVQANGTAGAVSVRATVTGATPVTFNLTNTPNLAPTNVTAGGPYNAVGGDNIVFQATATDPESDPLTYTWDLNGDGVFDDALGQTLYLTSIQLSSLGIATGFSTANVRVRVSDGTNTVTSSGATLAVNVFVPSPPPGAISPPPVSGSTATQLTAVAAGAGGGPHVRVYNADGSERFAFFAYNPGFTGGISTATGDVTGDGIEDVITGAGAGGGPHIKLYDGATGAELRSFFAFDPLFRNGVSIATGDVNGDGYADIIVGAGPGGGPHVKVFDGATGTELRSFFAFNPAFSGGVNVAAGDVNGDGTADIVVGAGAGGGPNVKVYDGMSMAIIRDFFTFGNGFTGGVTVAAGDVNRDGKAELLIGQASGGSTVTLISGANGAEMLTYSLTGANGVRVALSDVTGDGLLDPIVASAPGTGSVIRVLRTNGSVFREFSPFGGFTGGVYIG